MKLRSGRLPQVLVAVFALLAVGVIAACGGDDDGGNAGGEAIEVAGVFPFQLEGNPYNEVHDAAIRNAIEEVGPENINYEPVYGIPYTDRMTRTVEQLFQDGKAVVIDGLSAGELFFNACDNNPEGTCLGYYAYVDPDEVPAPNLQSFYTDQAPMYYVEGVAAGMLTETNTTGFVSAFDQPFNTVLVNAFALGCQSVNPDCEVRNVYVNSFFDPPATVEATTTLLDAGADVINDFMNDPTPVQEAERRDAWGFGIYTDQSARAPDAWVTGILWEPGLTGAYTRMFEEIIDGTFEPAGPIVFGTPDPVDLELAPFGDNVPPEVQDATLEALEAINDGENPFVGPITSADGEVMISEGEEVDLRGPFIYGEWTWPVEGVIGL